MCNRSVYGLIYKIGDNMSDYPNDIIYEEDEEYIREDDEQVDYGDM